MFAGALAWKPVLKSCANTAGVGAAGGPAAAANDAGVGGVAATGEGEETGNPGEPEIGADGDGIGPAGSGAL